MELTQQEIIGFFSKYPGFFTQPEYSRVCIKPAGITFSISYDGIFTQHDHTRRTGNAFDLVCELEGCGTKHAERIIKKRLDVKDRITEAGASVKTEKKKTIPCNNIITEKRLPVVTSGKEMPESFTFRPTDLSNVDIFEALAQGNLLFIPQRKMWHFFDGKRWSPDEQCIHVERYIRETIQSIYAISASLTDENQRKIAGAWALKSEDEARRKAIIAGAERRAKLVKSIDEFDKDQFLFNCWNGVIDLRNGNLLPHNPDFFMLKISTVEYRVDAQCPNWRDTISRAFQNNQELIDFYQKYSGYSMTGLTIEQILVFLWGKKQNAKSTITGAKFEIMGDYACRIGVGTLLAGSRRTPGGPSEDLARLAGIRAGYASEPPENCRFEDSTIKDITGGDVVNARHLRSRSFDFKPQMKLEIFGNHKPSLRGSDAAMRRRMRFIPFLHVFNPPDKNMPEKLRAEYPGILAWMVDGCLKWQKEGLGEPDIIKNETDNYFLENNSLRLFIEQGYVITENEKEKVTEEYKMSFSDFFEAFIEFTGKTRISKQRFSSMLRDEIGLEVVSGHGNKRFIAGIRSLKEIETPKNDESEDKQGRFEDEIPF